VFVNMQVFVWCCRYNSKRLRHKSGYAEKEIRAAGN
jgi:hypothetical protein